MPRPPTTPCSTRRLAAPCCGRARRLSVANERLSVAQDNLSALQKGDNSPQEAAATAVLAQAKSAAQQAQDAVAQAQANLDLLNAQMSKLEVDAPLDGVILTRNIEPGEYVQPGAAAIEHGEHLDVDDHGVCAGRPLWADLAGAEGQRECGLLPGRQVQRAW